VPRGQTANLRYQITAKRFHQSAKVKGRALIPENPDVLLTRPKTADALTEAGFPVTEATLATKATRGGGPPFQKFGSRVLYRWGPALQWAEARLSAPRRSTSERDAGMGLRGSQPGDSHTLRPQHHFQKD
jgi:hypothetical protein